MKPVDWTDIRREKELLRERNANESFAEKLRTLDRLRERSEAMRATKLRGSSRPRATAHEVTARRKK